MLGSLKGASEKGASRLKVRQLLLVASRGFLISQRITGHSRLASRVLRLASRVSRLASRVWRLVFPPVHVPVFTMPGFTIRALEKMAAGPGSGVTTPVVGLATARGWRVWLQRRTWSC